MDEPIDITFTAEQRRLVQRLVRQRLKKCWAYRHPDQIIEKVRAIGPGSSAILTDEERAELSTSSAVRQDTQDLEPLLPQLDGDGSRVVCTYWRQSSTLAHLIDDEIERTWDLESTTERARAAQRARTRQLDDTLERITEAEPNAFRRRRPRIRDRELGTWRFTVFSDEVGALYYGLEHGLCSKSRAPQFPLRADLAERVDMMANKEFGRRMSYLDDQPTAPEAYLLELTTAELTELRAAVDLEIRHLDGLIRRERESMDIPGPTSIRPYRLRDRTNVVAGLHQISKRLQELQETIGTIQLEAPRPG